MYVFMPVKSYQGEGPRGNSMGGCLLACSPCLPACLPVVIPHGNFCRLISAYLDNTPALKIESRHEGVVSYICSSGSIGNLS